ncbi:short-chain dehydrogenase [Novosphingobium marinum]|uniref:NAD(P)-dependent dehydrogenase (Short-subunit alcohol dehydrogenase family) n=1 Tax=Novosphingobium marinum TaxID=1514948 RepID=A0A7Y9XT52_9SPHN|nr:SDR family NAD(P)-dependent oxidoreductase [Novosphingobium marinum]NYH94044.1 NAD(P)-dependent dehydrogenase (short-subunit alcohol dehydrogenase family) [Novosphingobium marinum]GGC19163.1 short-chain dehydrogenase [Novosphingobium marinum]
MATYIVVAGAGGVGSSTVAALRAGGHRVIATVLNEAEDTAVRKADDSVETLRIDLSDPQAVRTVLARQIDQLDTLDGVAVCGAIAPLGPLESADLETARRVFDVNVLSDLAIYQAALPALRKSKGRLVMVSSMSGKASMAFVGVYSSSKFALEGLGDAMRREATPQGVSISLVLPGGVKTPMVDAQLRDNAAAIESLSAEEDARYGSLYRGFQAAAKASHEGTASPPEAVAEAIVEALTSEDPQPRYLVGDDAGQLVGAAGSLSDRDMDAMFAQMFAG